MFKISQVNYFLFLIAVLFVIIGVALVAPSALNVSGDFMVKVLPWFIAAAGIILVLMPSRGSKINLYFVRLNVTQLIGLAIIVIAVSIIAASSITTVLESTSQVLSSITDFIVESLPLVFAAVFAVSALAVIRKYPLIGIIFAAVSVMLLMISTGFVKI